MPVFFINMEPDNKPRPYFSLLLSLCLATVFPVSATELTITPTVYHFNYQEFDEANRLLDSEKGLLPGLEVSYRRPLGDGKITVDMAYFDGSVDYDMYNQDVSIHQTDTEQAISRLGISYLNSSNTEFPGKLFASLHFWQWDRKILTRDNVQGLHEIYTWYEAELGLRFQTDTNGDSNYWLEVSGLYIVDPEMELFLPASREKFNLGSGPGFRIRAGKSGEFNPNLGFSIGIFAEYWEFGRSNTIYTDDFFGNSGYLVEPRSESLHSGIEFALIYAY